MTQNRAVHSTYVFGVLQLPGDSLLFTGSGSAGLVPLLLRRSGELSVLFWCLRAISERLFCSPPDWSFKKVSLLLCL